MTKEDGSSPVHAALVRLAKWDGAPYDGILGLPPKWIPRPLYLEFVHTRNFLLDAGNAPEQILAWIRSYRGTVEATSFRSAYWPPEYERDIETLVYVQDLVNLGEVDGIEAYLGVGAYKVLRSRVVSQRNRTFSQLPRRKRRPHNLWYRAFRRVLRDNPKMTATDLRELIRAEGSLTFDAYGDVDIQLSLEGDDVVIQDLRTEETARVHKDSQRKYLQRARDS